MNSLNIAKHPIDRTALIAGIMFTFAGLAYLVDDHGLINVTEGAVAGTVVIVIGLVLLLAAVIDSPETPQLASEVAVDSTDDLFGGPSAPEEPTLFDESSELRANVFDEAE